MMPVINLSHTPSILGNILAELRDKDVQKDAYRFRHNIEQAGFIMAYEMSKHLTFSRREVQTPLAGATEQVVDESLVLTCVMRAAVPMFNGFQKVFRQAESAFVGAMRKEEGDAISANVSYVAAPDLSGKTLILIDPMLATGHSICECYHNLTHRSKPKRCIIASLFAVDAGIKRSMQTINPDWLFAAAVDSELNAKSYIVPGLGDAGDLAFGNKVE